MTRRRLTRKRSALNPEPNMINTFCGEEGWSLNQELPVSTPDTVTAGEVKKFPKQTSLGLPIRNLVIYK